MDHVVVVVGPVPEDLSGTVAFVAQRFKIPEERAAQLLRRVPGPVTKAVPEAQARTVAAILAEAGLNVELREGGPDGPAVPFATAAPPAFAPASEPEPTQADVAAEGARPLEGEALPERGAGTEAPPFDPRAERLDIDPAPAREQAAPAVADELDGPSDEAPTRTEGEGRSTHAPPAGTTTTLPPRDPMKTTLTREPPDVDRHGLRRRITTAATLPAVLTLLAALVVLTFTLLPALRAQQLERAQGTATAVAATIEGLSGGLPLSSPLVRTQLRVVEERTAAQLSAQGVSYMVVLEPDGNTLLRWEGDARELTPAARAQAEEVLRGQGEGAQDGLVDSLARTWRTFLAVVGLGDVEPVVAAAPMERNGSPLGAVVVGVDPAGMREELGRVLLTTLLVGLIPVLFAVLAALALSRGITDAVRYLLVATDRISHGDLERPVELRRDDELGQIATAVERMRISLREGMERLRRRR